MRAKFTDVASGLTERDLHRIFEYLPWSGELMWRIGPHEGKVAGYLHHSKGKSYWAIRLRRRTFLAHRLIWAYVHGAWPPDEIDHRDGNGLNNKLSNLREADRSGNCGNARLSRKNSSGVKGVHWHAANECWIVQAYDRSGLPRYRGSFRDLDEAKKVRREIAEQHFGEFARE